MTIADVNNQWNKIDRNSPLKSIRLSSACKSELFLGYDDDNRSRLILSLQNKTISINDDIKEYISIQYFDISKHLIVTLKEEKFKSVFNSFVLSVFEIVKDIEDSEKVALDIVRMYFDWSEFFSDSLTPPLSLNDLIGLYGELFKLNQLVESCDATSINDVLRSWAGPMGRSHDFVFESIDWEVKTIQSAKNRVMIASEYQLQTSENKGLLLKVLKVEINNGFGTRLSEVANGIKNSIVTRLGDLSIFTKSLQKARIPFFKMDEYDNYTFDVKVELTFDCSSTKFPKLTRDNCPSQLCSISYELNIGELDAFLIETKTV